MNEDGGPNGTKTRHNPLRCSRVAREAITRLLLRNSTSMSWISLMD